MVKSGSVQQQSSEPWTDHVILAEEEEATTAGPDCCQRQHNFSPTCDLSIRQKADIARCGSGMEDVKMHRPQMDKMKGRTC